jgi:hypothetical protein
MGRFGKTYSVTASGMFLPVAIRWRYSDHEHVSISADSPQTSTYALCSIPRDQQVT